MESFCSGEKGWNNSRAGHTQFIQIVYNDFHRYGSERNRRKVYRITMKKIITTLIAAAILMAALPLSLTSCSDASRLLRMKEPRRAAEFYRLINENTNRATSNSLEQTTSLSMDLNGQRYEQVSEGVITYIEAENDFTYLKQVKTTIRSGQMETVLYEDSGYTQGTMFLYNREDSLESGLKSAITAKEYDDFMAELNSEDLDIQVGEGYCETMTCVQNEDQSWTATYEGFTEAGMKPFEQMLSGVEYAVTDRHTLVDVRMTCTADKNFYPSEIQIEYLFEAKPDADADTQAPAVTVHTRYKGWNNTVLSTPYDLSDFTEVEDLRTVERFLDALNRRGKAESGAFSVLTSANSRYGDKGENTEFTQNVTYHNQDGVDFTLDYTQFGYKVHSSYENGTLTTTIQDEQTGAQLQNNSVPIRNYEAQAMLQQLMNSESVSGLDIVDAKITDAEKGICRFTLGDAVRNDQNEEYMNAYGTAIDQFTGYIDATVVDGKLMSYVYYVNNTLTVNGVTLTITITTTVTFTELVEDGGAL